MDFLVRYLASAQKHGEKALFIPCALEKTRGCSTLPPEQQLNRNMPTDINKENRENVNGSAKIIAHPDPPEDGR